MQIGDLIHWRASETDPYQLWLVFKVDLELNTAFVVSENYERQVVDLDSDSLVAHNLLRDWLQITLPVKRGRIRSLMVGSTQLLWLHDWARVGEFQIGGVVYVNPSLQLRYGQKITVVRDKGSVITVPVPRFLLSGEQKERLRKEAEKEEDTPKRAPGIYGLLRDDD